LTLDKKKQAELIEQLTSKKEEQAQLIESLTSDKKKQAELIKQLTSKKEEQAQLIESLTSDKKKQAGLIQSLTSDKEKQAQLISGLTSDKKAQAKLIVLLTSEKEEQIQLVKSLTATKKEQEELIKELSQAKTKLTTENTVLREQVKVLTEQLEKLKTDQSKTATVDDDNEVNFQIIIKTKLFPLTKKYLMHLAQEIKKSVAPDLDVNDFSSLANKVNKIENWPEDQSSQILKQKFDGVSKLYDILKSKNKPSEKISQFYQKLNDVDQVIQAHRDPAWKRYTYIALSILVTGIIPGLGILVYSALSGNTPSFWQSSGQTFFQSAKREIENNMAGDLTPPLIKVF
jgi:mannitol/fructose-specific phosphotransferase system IIA component